MTARSGPPGLHRQGRRPGPKAIRELRGRVGVPTLRWPVVEIGQQIPEDFFQAVAEVLAFIYPGHQAAAPS